MLITNRSVAPSYSLIESIEMIKATEKRLNNTIPVYLINGGTQDVVKIEFLFDAGMFYQLQPLQAVTVNAMLEEGTTKFTASQIASIVDFYGAYLETSITQDTASVVLYTLNKHINEVLPIVEAVIKDAVFPDNELNIHLNNKKQLFYINNQKVANVARKNFTAMLFGENHPYGIMVKEIDFENIKKENLIEFYNKFYNSQSCKIIVAGKFNDDELIKLLNKHFGENEWNKQLNYDDDKKYISNFTKIAKSVNTRQNYIEMNGVMQSAIRIGKLLFNKTHQDFKELQILNTVLGGYFGSRLMMNIREDKGYTYGIGSGLVSLKNGGYFFISTEVGVDVCKNATNEIYFELQRLTSELIHEQELELVKNFMMGSFMRSMDGPFAMADRFKSILEYNLTYDYYDSYFSLIKKITPQRLKDLAVTYFDKNSMIELVVGKQ